jgi:hypothetical protein
MGLTISEATVQETASGTSREIQSRAKHLL